MTKIKNKKQKFDTMKCGQRNQNSQMQNSAATLENSLTVYYNIKYILIIYSDSLTWIIAHKR